MISIRPSVNTCGFLPGQAAFRRKDSSQRALGRFLQLPLLALGCSPPFGLCHFFTRSRLKFAAVRQFEKAGPYSKVGLKPDVLCSSGPGPAPAAAAPSSIEAGISPGVRRVRCCLPWHYRLLSPVRQWGHMPLSLAGTYVLKLEFSLFNTHIELHSQHPEREKRPLVTIGVYSPPLASTPAYGGRPRAGLWRPRAHPAGATVALALHLPGTVPELSIYLL